MSTIAILGTMDTKGEEHAYVADLIHKRGHKTLVIDVGALEPPKLKPDVTREEVAKAAGADLAALVARKDRGETIKAMSLGFIIREDEAAIWRGPMVQSALMQFLNQVNWAPLDVLVLCSEPVQPLAIVVGRPIGVMRMLDGGRIDDKIIAITASDPAFAEYEDISQLPRHVMHRSRCPRASRARRALLRGRPPRPPLPMPLPRTRLKRARRGSRHPVRHLPVLPVIGRLKSRPPTP